MLNNFFKINLPYGMIKNENGEWACFNREYVKLGTKSSQSDLEDKNLVFTKYKGITSALLMSFANNDEDAVQKKEGEIFRVFFYNDFTNPCNGNHSKKEQKLFFDMYFKKLENLSSLERSGELHQML